MASRRPVGLDKLKRQVLGLSPAARDVLVAGNKQSAQQLVSAIRSRVPVRRGALKASVDWCEGDAPATKATGALRSANRGVKSSSELGQFLISQGLRVSVYAGNDKAYYPRWVNSGTKPGYRDLTRKADRQYKGTVRTKRTDNRPGRYFHPGTKPTFFWSIPIRAWRKQIRGRAVRSVGKAVKVAVNV